MESKAEKASASRAADKAAVDEVAGNGIPDALGPREWAESEGIWLLGLGFAILEGGGIAGVFD